MQEKSRVIECVAVCGIDPELENSIDITQCIEVLPLIGRVQGHHGS